MAEKWITPLHRDFPGKKFISVPDPTYSEGRRRVKTKAYEAFLAKARTVEKGEEELLELYKKLKKSLKRNPTVWEMHSKGKTRVNLKKIKRILEKNKLSLSTPRGGLRDEIIQIHKQLTTELGRSPKTTEIAELITDSKQSAKNLQSHIGRTLQKANLTTTVSEAKWEPEARTKAAETIMETKRVENFLSAEDKKKLFAEIRKYRSGARVGPEATMKIMDFAKYFPAGTSQTVISRQVNRVANDILKLPEHPVFTEEQSLAKRRAMEAVKRKGDPTWITKKLKGTPEMPLHHMRAKSISPALANLTYTDVVTNSVKLRPYEESRDNLLNQQRKVFREKKLGWEKELEKLNFKARKYSNDIPRELRGLLYYEQMDKAGNLKAIGGNPMKSIAKLAPEGEIAFNTLTKESPLRKTILDFAKSNKGGVCGIFRAEGGRIGFAAGSSCVAEMETALRTDPIKTTEQISRLPGNKTINSLKTAAGGFLKTLGRGGVRAAPYAALAAVGAAAEPLVKQFHIDDRTTYLTDENQMKGMLLATLEGEPPKVDEEILKWQMPALGAATAAGAIPGAGEVFKGRLAEGVGKTRAALGIKGVLGKALGASFSPLAVAATTPISIAAQRAGGTDYGDIATDPMNWMGPAFASTGAEMATRGIKNPMLANAIRLGISPRTLSLVSRRFGLPGLAISAGMWGYDKWKNRSVNDED